MSQLPGETEPVEELNRWLIVFKTHWTLDVVDALSEQDRREFFSVREGLIKAEVWPSV